MQIRAQSENATTGIWLGNISAEPAVFSVNGAPDTIQPQECRLVDLTGITPWSIEADPCVVCSFDYDSLIALLGQ